MTQSEKINLMEEVIRNLYEKEGRNISYIARVVNVDRSMLSKQIRAWKLVKAQVRHNKPSTQKFLNKYSNLIIARLSANVAMTDIAKEIGVTRDKLLHIVNNDPKLSKAKEERDTRRSNKKETEGRERNYFEDIDGEEWKPIVGFNGYFVSNMGRFKRYLPSYDCYSLVNPSSNSKNGRLYVGMTDNNGKARNVMAARVVAHAFCSGYSETNNTVDHKDMDVTNNKADNLEWVSQAENNRRKYQKLPGHCGFSRNGRYKDILLNGEYHFKTIRALARFLGVSESQASRYISGETKFNGTIELIY